MTPAERREHCRRIASSGGRRTVEIHGTSHMSQIGKAGFAKALELGWGLQLAAKLANSYIAKFGKPLQLGTEPQRKARIRSAARRMYDGRTCEAIGCESPGQVHHLEIDGDDPNNGGYIKILCEIHHRERHREIRRNHLRFPQ
jgi:hypothetical protein